MRVLILVGSLGMLTLASIGCESILGIDDHKLASQGDSGLSGTGADGGTPEATDSAVVDGSPDSGPTADGSTGGGSTDSGQVDSPGKPVPPLQCGDSGACMSGGIFSVGRTPDMAGGGVATLPDGRTVTLTDDGFEFGEALCSGITCVAGGLTP